MSNLQELSAKWKLSVKVKTKFLKIVGSENFFDDRVLLQTYASNFSYHPAENPNCVVRPTSSEEVLTIIQLCDKNKIPLVPCSAKVHF